MTLHDGPGSGELDAPGAGSFGVSEALSPALVRLRLDISYDGTDFAGWAVQPGLRTVAGELAAALGVLLRTEVALVVAGRTDAGVHASGQVAHLDVDVDRLTALTPRNATSSVAGGSLGLLRRANGLLPADVRVTGARQAPAGFDARFAAIRRHYRYRIATAPSGAAPLRRLDTLSWARPLDVAVMRAAAATLLGLHDFAAYCRAPANDGATTIRELQRLDILEVADEPGVVVVSVSADAFCHSMVRALVGVLLSVGSSRLDPDRPAAILAARERTSAVHTAPAHGLTLVSVDYPPDDELAARAAQTRAVRGR
jgi:tRNA pseudouridine38-40 synthase